MNKHIEAFVNLVRLARITGTQLDIHIHGESPGQPVALTVGSTIGAHSGVRVQGAEDVATALRRAADLIDGTKG